MSLGQFVKQTMDVFGDALQARFCADNNKALILWVHEYKTGLKTKHAPNGDGEGVVVDVLDLSTFGSDPEGSVYCNVLWMGLAVRDQLKPYAGSGQPLPVKLSWTQPQGGGNAFVQPEQLEGQWLQYAEQVYQMYPTFVTDVKAKRKAAWDAEHANSAVPQVQPQVPALPTLNGPAPVQQQQAPVAAPPVQQQASTAPPIQQAVQAPAQPAVPPMQAPGAPPQAPVTAPPVAAPQAPQAPAQAPAMQPPAAPGQVTDTNVEALLAQLNAG